MTMTKPPDTVLPMMILSRAATCNDVILETVLAKALDIYLFTVYKN